jgi:hypothetical protein
MGYSSAANCGAYPEKLSNHLAITAEEDVTVTGERHGSRATGAPAFCPSPN